MKLIDPSTDLSKPLTGEVKINCPMCGMFRKVHIEFDPGESSVEFTFKCPRNSCGATRTLSLNRGQITGKKEDKDYL